MFVMQKNNMLGIALGILCVIVVMTLLVNNSSLTGHGVLDSKTVEVQSLETGTFNECTQKIMNTKDSCYTDSRSVNTECVNNAQSDDKTLMRQELDQCSIDYAAAYDACKSNFDRDIVQCNN